MSVEPVLTPAATPSSSPISRPIPAATGNPIVSPERSILKAAWMAVALGIAIEGLIVATSGLFGAAAAARPVSADLAQKVSWSVLVCVALALARTASRAHLAVLGGVGLLAAPAAFVVARGVHKGAAQALGLVAAQAAAPSPALLAILKGLEYAALGLAIAWIAKKSWGGLAAHAAAGAAAGIAFGVPVLLLTAQALPELPLAAFVARAVNELIFPVGCALVLYASDTLGKRLG
jgi:hypothetical protein